jgi:hypothetical protein
MIGSLFIKTTGEYALDAFGSKIARLLNLPLFQKRQSDNYLGGEYLLCEVLGITITISLCDQENFQKYQFLLLLEPSVLLITNNRFCVDLADFVARQLAFDGYFVAREDHLGRIGSAYTLYRKNENPNASHTEKVISERIDTEE